jgi:hypothetical protein
MAITRQQLVNNSNWFLLSAPFIEPDGSPGKPELEFVEVWEKMDNNKYFLWDLEEERLLSLHQGDHKDFMDAAETFEQHVIQRQNPTRKQEMEAQIAASDTHRSHRGTIGHGAEQDTLPGIGDQG